MYLQHFQLHRQPFCEHAAVVALWQDTRMDERLARLEYLVEHGALGLITGVSGVGKSALLKRFLHGLAPQQREAIYCHLTHLPSAGLLKLLVSQLGEVPRLGKDCIYKQILERAERAEGTLLLVFDEAHLIDSDADHAAHGARRLASAHQFGPGCRATPEDVASRAGSSPCRAQTFAAC